MARTPKPLNIGGTPPATGGAPSTEQPACGRVPRPLAVSAPSPRTPAPAPVVVPPAPSRAPKPLNVQTPAHVSSGPPRELNIGGRDGSKVDAMLARAFDIDADMVQFKFRLKPRFDTLLLTSTDDIINWGERNLTALRDVTQEKVKIAKRISDIDATGWIKKTQEEATRVPSFMDRFTQRETPAFYQAKLKEVRTKLSVMLPELSHLREEIFPDAEDLRMDIMALRVMVEWMDDGVGKTFAQNRVSTLVASQQTVLMVLQTIDNTKVLCGTSIQTIDELLTITIPNWEIARSSR